MPERVDGYGTEEMRNGESVLSDLDTARIRQYGQRNA
jgi:hypothetical protein